MTEYTEILLSDLEEGDPWTATKAQSSIFNPIAICEQDQTAIDAGIYVPGGWYIDDGAGGTDPVWSYSVDGAVSGISSTVFEAGWDYMFVMDGLVTSAITQVEFGLYADTSGAYDYAQVVSSSSTGREISGRAIVRLPFRTSHHHFASVALKDLSVSSNDFSAASYAEELVMTRATAQKVSRMRIRVASGTFNAGKVYVLRRKGMQY